MNERTFNLVFMVMLFFIEFFAGLGLGYILWGPS